MIVSASADRAKTLKSDVGPHARYSGPEDAGEAKLQLQKRLSLSKALAERIVGIETTDKLTDPQIVAKVKEHYRIDHYRLAAVICR